MNPEDLELLLAWTMPYGKYKDRLLSDLPGHYLTWFARNGFPEGKLGQLLALMHESDPSSLVAHSEIMYVSELCVRTMIESHREPLH